MRFVDEVVISVTSGRGGPGAVSFRREKFVPRGGPDGGDGGRGGDIVIEADPQLGTLLDLRFRPEHRADNGMGGQGTLKTGRSGDDHVIHVPLGTLVTDDDTAEILADLTEPGSRVVAARGGRGGKGNAHFATSTNQAPRYSQPGEDAESRRLRLSLKLLADVGLVGFPNSGKSTLIARLSAARPRIADYPFTTLVPNLGMVRTDERRSFCLADIPGLIEGASEGAGLGHRFLKHVERVYALAILLDVSAEPHRHPVTDYQTLIRELGAYSPDLLTKPRALVLTKADLPDTEAAVADIRAIAEGEGCPFFVISAVRGDGLSELLYALQGIVDVGRSKSDAPRETDSL